MLTGKMRFVTWEDSIGGGDWEHTKGREPTVPLICQSIGWLVHENDEFVELALTVAGKDSDREQINATISIPRSAILSILDVPTTQFCVDT